MNSKYYSPLLIQNKLLKIGALFLSIYSLALTLSPAARLQDWNSELRWSHWIGFAIWCGSIILIHSQIARFTPDADPYLFPLAATLSGWGVLTIWRLDSGFGLRQAMWLGFCAILFSGSIRFPNLNLLRRYKYIFLFSGLILTGLTLIFGTNPGGSGPRLWLGCCGLYLQPSEPLKLLLIVYLAAFFADQIPMKSSLISIVIPSLLLTGIAIAILLTQRDMGTAGIFIFIYASMLYLASGKRRILLISLLLLISACLVGYFYVDIIRYRLTAWIDPWSDPTGRSYQIIQSILAVANGGFYGRGPGMGAPGLVPVAHSDFIFTSIFEENGLLGSIALLVILALITFRGFLISIKASSNFQRLLAVGITIYFCGQSILIIGGNLRVLPLTGVTLPFISYGGSSLLTSFIGLLILVQTSNNAEEDPAPLPTPQPFMFVAGLLGVGLLSCALASGWWSDVRADELLARTDNPRRAIADQFVLRGALMDRKNRAIDITVGQPGNYVRKYLVPQLSSITGYTHPVYGQAGLESSLDAYLRGLKGNPSILIWWENVLYGQPPAGLNLRLTLDIDLQKQADALLDSHIGTLVLVNAQTGEVLAMASHPTFDANKLDTDGMTLPKALDAPLINRATQGQYPITTIIAPILAANYNDPVSSNSVIVDFYNRLGFYSPPNIYLPIANASEKGTVKDLAVSPVQMASAVAALSNQGICPEIQIASAVEIPSQGWVVLAQPDTPKQCLSSEGVKQETKLLQVQGKPFWEYSTSSSEKDVPLSSFISGTMPNWSGTPLAVVVILEEKNPSLARFIGSQLLQKSITPN